MIRFWRLLFFIFSLSIFIPTVLRTIQPQESTGLYQVIYGDTFPRVCCSAFLINEERREANRVRLGVADQPAAVSQISPSNDWRFANVSTPQGNRSYLIPLDGSDPMRLPEAVNNVEDAFWSTQADVLFYLQRNEFLTTALFRLTPDNPDPVRLSRYQFFNIRTIHEQPLPTTSFTPLVLLFYTVNMLVIAGGLRHSQAK